MEINNLSQTTLPEIVHCLTDAFADYFVKIPAEVDFWERRWKGARADYNFSYGVFDNEQLVGFMIHGMDESEGLKTAFNTGTGVVPSHRGQRLVKQLYEYAIPELRKAGVQKCSLEVIQENDKAIKAYRSVGFEITKSLRCYQGKLQTPPAPAVEMIQKPLSAINWQDYPPQHRFSWDFHKNGLLLFDDWQCFEVFNKQDNVGYFIINPKNGMLAQFDIFIEGKQNWQCLFAAIQQVSKTLRIINVDDRQRTKIKAIEELGLTNFLNQFEMELFL